MSRPDLMPLAIAERRDLADFLATLMPEQWEVPSLCEGWTVRQVAAHVVSYDELSLGRVLRMAPRGPFSIPRTNHRVLAAYGNPSPAEVLTAFHDHLRPRGITTMFRGAIALTDGLIHHQDIRRALGIPREVPADRLLPVLDFMPKALALPSRRNVRGLRLVATDLDWTHGAGPEVTGSGEALVMAIAGRSAVLADLDGPGAVTLRDRLRA